jgi:hypothetical protein
VVDEKDALGFFGQLLAAIAAAWATVARMFSSRIGELRAALVAQSEHDEQQRERMRAANHADIQRLESKVDRNHETVMAHLMDIKGKLR